MREAEIYLDAAPEMPYVTSEQMTGNQLRQLRLAHDLTQQDLAAEIGITREAVSMWERRKGKLTLRSFRDVHRAIRTLIEKRERKTA